MFNKILIANCGDAMRGRAAILSTRVMRAAHERDLAAETSRV
ncbi:hypothetical protein BSY238_1979 [Methyloversatilis sp. RAC08]|nr:hypothetical protein [Methyloversatilis sp. RAC08]AOF83168.1 hypothetical protein BSY238_1979 [Methyloversatilis sp. RAC08]